MPSRKLYHRITGNTLFYSPPFWGKVVSANTSDTRVVAVLRAFPEDSEIHNYY
jgi:hypothetical protein